MVRRPVRRCISDRVGRRGRRDWKRRFHRGQAAVQRNYNDLVRHAAAPDSRAAPLTGMVDLHGESASDIDDAFTARMARQRYLYEPGRRFEFLQRSRPPLRVNPRPRSCAAIRPRAGALIVDA